MEDHCSKTSDTYFLFNTWPLAFPLRKDAFVCYNALQHVIKSAILDLASWGFHLISSEMMQRRTNSEILPKKSVKKEFRPRREVAMAMLNKAPGETGETTKFG